jgi:WD40 repeat protein
VFSLSFRADGNLLAVGTADGTAGLWDISDPRAPKLAANPIRFGPTVTSVAFRPDGAVLAIAGYHRLASLWDVQDPVQPRKSARRSTTR